MGGGFSPPPGMPSRPGMGTTQNPGGIMPPHMQQPRPMQMGVPQQQNPISLAPGGMMRRPGPPTTARPLRVAE